MKTAEEWVAWAYEEHDPDMPGDIPWERVIAAAQAEARREALEEAARIAEGELVTINGPEVRVRPLAEVIRIRAFLAEKIRERALSQPPAGEEG